MNKTNTKKDFFSMKVASMIDVFLQFCIFRKLPDSQRFWEWSGHDRNRFCRGPDSQNYMCYANMKIQEIEPYNSSRKPLKYKSLTSVTYYYLSRTPYEGWFVNYRRYMEAKHTKTHYDSKYSSSIMSWKNRGSEVVVTFGSLFLVCLESIKYANLLIDVILKKFDCRPKLFFSRRY